jgi:hypothetical protein
LIDSNRRTAENFLHVGDNAAVGKTGLAVEVIEKKFRRKAKALHHPPHVVAGTAANQVLELAGIGEWTA